MSSELTKNEAASSVISAFTEAFRNYFNVKGRTCRYDYWGFVLVNWLICVLLKIAERIEPSIAYVFLIYALLMLIPGITIFVRRLHDINKGYWRWCVLKPLGYLLVAGVVCVIIVALGTKFGMNASLVSGLCYIIVGATALIWGIIIAIFPFLKGNAESNAFGDPVTEDDEHKKKVKWLMFFGVLIMFVNAFIDGVNAAQNRQNIQSGADVNQIQQINVDVNGENAQ